MIFKEWNVDIDGVDIDNVIDMIEANSNNGLLNAFRLRNEKSENFFDELIGNIVAYHLHRVGMRIKKFSYSDSYDYSEKSSIIEKEKIYVEYWFKSENNTYYHIDYDEYERTTTKKEVNKPMFTGILYFTKSKTPTLIYDKGTRDIGIIFPDRMKHILFNGGELLHGSSSEIYKNNDRRVILAFAAYNNDVEYTPYLDINSIYQSYFMKKKENVRKINNDFQLNIIPSEITVREFPNQDEYYTNFHKKMIGNECCEQEYMNIREEITSKGSYILKYANYSPNHFLYRINENEEDKEEEKEEEKEEDKEEDKELIIDEKSILNTKLSNVFLERKIIDVTTCNWLLSEVKKTVKRNGGWNNKRHERYPTYDIDIDKLDTSVRDYILLTYRDKLNDLMYSLFNINSEEYGTNIAEVFILRYSLDTQTKLDYHSDSSDMSIIISLNNEGSFDGGGTEFINGLIMKPQQGDCIIFCSKNKHRGIEITYGERILMVFFIKLEKKT